MSILQYFENLETAIAKHKLDDIALILKDQFAINNSKSMQQEIQSIDQKGRLLKIGIVGRVKAGKSSLINALVFDGNDILPRAATPMTAALTVLEYSDSPSAEIEFYSENDLKIIKKRHDDFITQWDTNTAAIEKKLTELNKRKQTELNKRKQNQTHSAEEVHEKAKKRAFRELKSNLPLYSAYDQHKRINGSDFSFPKSETVTIEATTNQELSQKLLDYVGSEGKYMPFTKLATLKLVNNQLKDIQIVDTPGVNDPVASRVIRTREMLNQCDVIFIVSPAGQFLSAEDISLMDRITSKEGILEVHIIASQVDNQLSGDLQGKSKGVLSTALSMIREALSTHMKQIFSNTETITSVPAVLKLQSANVTLSSGIAYGISKKLESDNLASLNDIEKHVWETILQPQYPEYFSDKTTSLANLSKIANIEHVKSILNNVRAKKKEIIQAKRDDYLNAKKQAITKLKNSLLDHLQQNIQQINNTSLNELIQQKSKLNDSKQKGSDGLSIIYKENINKLKRTLKNDLKATVKIHTKEFRQESNAAKGTDVGERDKKGFLATISRFLGGGKEAYTYETINANQVNNALLELFTDVSDDVNACCDLCFISWKREFQQSVTRSLRETLGDENVSFNQLNHTLKLLVHQFEPIDFPDFEAPEEIMSYGGILSEREADHYTKIVSTHIRSFIENSSSIIKTYATKQYDGYCSIDFAELFFQTYSDKINAFEEQIKNSEISITKLERAYKEIEAIQ